MGRVEPATSRPFCRCNKARRELGWSCAFSLRSAARRVELATGTGRVGPFLVIPEAQHHNAKTHGKPEQVPGVHFNVPVHAHVNSGNPTHPAMNTRTPFNVHAGTSCIAWTAMTVPSTPPWASMYMLILNHG